MQSFLFTPNWTSIEENASKVFLSDHDDLSKLTDEELRSAFSQFTPKSDWDRFFSSKIPIDNVTDLIDNIRRYRNSVAHFKYFDGNDYKCCNNMVKQLNKSINEAIKITENVDFAEKNLKMIKETLSGFVERWDRIMEPIVSEMQRMQRNIVKSIQPLIDALDRCKTVYNPLIQSESDDIEKNNQDEDNSDNVKNDAVDNQ